MKLPANEDVQTRGEAPFYVDEKAVNDYYPFGMLIADDGSDNRSWQAGNYRYGYNGKENDNEVKGDGNQIDYGFRIYDPRIAKFLSVDPLTKSYPMLTPYQFASNRPIDGIDLDGLEYATFNIYEHNGKVTAIDVSTDYELKNPNTKGAGILYNVISLKEDPKNPEIPIVRTTSTLVRNLYGIYLGGENPKLPKVGGSINKWYDDYSLKPIDEADNLAKQHDLEYDEVNAKGSSGVFINNNTLNADRNFRKGATNSLFKASTGKTDKVSGKKMPIVEQVALTGGAALFFLVDIFKVQPKQNNNKMKDPKVTEKDNTNVPITPKK